MFAAKAVAQNVAMRSSRVRQFAERRHDTGLQGRSGGAAHVLSRLTSTVPFELDGRRVLELSPGRGRDLMAGHGPPLRGSDSTSTVGESPTRRLQLRPAQLGTT